MSRTGVDGDHARRPFKDRRPVEERKVAQHRRSPDSGECIDFIADFGVCRNCKRTPEPGEAAREFYC